MLPFWTLFHLLLFFRRLLSIGVLRGIASRLERVPKNIL